MRILLTLHHRLDPNAGAARVVIRLRDEFRALGHEAETLSFDDLPARVPAKLAPFAFPWFVARALRSRAGGYDVVDAGSGDGWRAFRRPLSGRPLTVTHSHGLEPMLAQVEQDEARREGRRVPLQRRLLRYGLRLREVGRSFQGADLSLVLNGAEAAYLRDHLGIPADRIRVAQLAVDDAVLDAPLAPPDADGTVTAVQIGSYTARKGIAATAAAMIAAMARHPALRLRFVGTGAPAERVLADYPAALHPRISVVPHYRNDALAGLLAGARIGLMPSLFEGYGIAKLELMARGLVPIVSDDGGARTDVEDGVTGFVVPAGDAPALEAAVERCLSNPDRLAAMREHALAFAARRRWRDAAALRIEHYAQAIAARSSAIEVRHDRVPAHA